MPRGSRNARREAIDRLCGGDKANRDEDGGAGATTSITKGELLPSLEFHPEGRCLFCGLPKAVLLASLQAPSGICDVCAYIARETWQEKRGLFAVMSGPEILRTYVLVPKLLPERAEIDLSGYVFLTDAHGHLPGLPITGADKVSALLAERYGCVTWPELLHRVSVGYDSQGQLSEVLLATAWGFVPGQPRNFPSKSFAAMIEEGGVGAGFVLTVKTAFETVLWKREMAPDTHLPCTHMREPAVRWLAWKLVKEAGVAKAQVDDDGVNDDAMAPSWEATMIPAEMKAAMVVLDHQAMQRRAAAELAREAGAKEEQKKPAEAASPKAADTASSEGSGETGGDEISFENDVDEGGFVRSRQGIKHP